MRSLIEFRSQESGNLVLILRTAATLNTIPVIVASLPRRYQRSPTHFLSSAQNGSYSIDFFVLRFKIDPRQDLAEQPHGQELDPRQHQRRGE